MKNKIPKSKCNNAGFTLIEVTISIIIVGVGIVSLMMLFAAGTNVNEFGNDLSTAVFLTDQLRSMTDEVEFDNLSSFNNQTYNGVDADGNEIEGLGSYLQKLTVQPVNPVDMTVFVGPDPQAFVITASVSENGAELANISWLRMY